MPAVLFLLRPSCEEHFGLCSRLDHRRDRTFLTGPCQCRFRRTCEKRDRKSTRLNSSHVAISYAVFCLKKKKTIKIADIDSTQESTEVATLHHSRDASCAS